MLEKRDRQGPIGVLHLVDCLNPGGTESQLLGQLRNLDRRRVRSLVGCFHEGGVLLDEVLSLDVPVRAFPLRKSLAHPNTALQIARIAIHCLRERAGIIHAHDFYGNLVGVAAARLCGARVIASRRDLGHWLRPSQKRALGHACRLADRVVANSRSVVEMSGAFLSLPAHRVDVVPNGIDLAAFDAEARLPPEPDVPWLAESTRPIASEPVLAVVANMNLPDKGQADLLRALALLNAREGLRVRLLLVGDGRERARLEGLAHELELGDQTRFLGRRRDVPRILKRVRALCLPSWAEGFPNAVMEGMAAGLPVIATRVGGCPELVEDGVTGWLVPPRSPEALASAIARVCRHETDAIAMGMRARNVVATRYSLTAAAAAYVEIYEQLSGRETARPAVVA